MKKSLVLYFLLLTGSLCAQSDTSLLSLFHGGFLQIHGGAVYNNSHGINTALNTIKPQGRDFPIGDKPFEFKDINLGYNGGFGVMAIFDRGIMLGLSLDYNYLAKRSNEFCELRLHGASVQGNLGKIILNRNSVIIYPHIGIGFYKYLMYMRNPHPTEGVFFSHEKPLKPGESQVYISNHPVFELGITMKRMIAKKFTIGLDLGIYFSTTKQDFWRQDKERVNERASPGLNGAFAKLTIDLWKFGKKSYIIDTTIAPPADSTLTPKQLAEKVKKEEKKKKTVKKNVKKEPVNYNELYFNFGKDAPPPPIPKPILKDTTNKTTVPIEPEEKPKPKSKSSEKDSKKKKKK